MRLNKYQRAWIAKLKSGETKKAKRTLNHKNGYMCCLGVGIKVCGLEPMPSTNLTKRPLEVINDEGITYFPKTQSALGLKIGGEFDITKVKKKWLPIIDNCETLVGLNDCTNMSHAQIGQFIDENREAVFYSSDKN